MPRVRPRPNIYALLPILATLIMAFGITLTWLRIAEYLGPEPTPRPVPPAPGRRVPEPPKAPPKKAPATSLTTQPTEGLGGETAPEEGAPTTAPSTTPATKPATGAAPAAGVTPTKGTLDEEDEP